MRRRHRTSRRHKLSTTISGESHHYLRRMVQAGHAGSIAEAVDRLVWRARRAEERARLATDTAAYFAKLPAEAAEEENRLAQVLSQAAGEVSFDA